jgi:hypothetical protein
LVLAKKASEIMKSTLLVAVLALLLAGFAVYRSFSPDACSPDACSCKLPDACSCKLPDACSCKPAEPSKPVRECSCKPMKECACKLAKECNCAVAQGCKCTKEPPLLEPEVTNVPKNVPPVTESLGPPCRQHGLRRP